MLTVCYLFQDQYPWDIRVDKIMNSLADNGIEGHIISRNETGLIGNEQLRENLYVHRVPYVSNPYLNKFINFPAFFSPFWLKAILDVIRVTSPDLFIVRDLPLAPSGLIAGRLASIPVLLDMAENYPAMIMDTWTYRGPSAIDRIIRNPWALKSMEKALLPRFDRVIVVSEYSADRVVSIGCERDAIAVVKNTPRLNELNSDANRRDADDLRKLSNFILLYTGGLEETRGIATVVRALPQIIKEIPDALFVIVGKGTSEKTLRSLAHRLGIEDHVIFKGWLPHKMLPSIIAQSDVCLVPHYVTEHTETTIPNKIFDYMAQKKPVVVTNAKALKSIVESCRCGIACQDTRPDDLANQIVKLKDSQLRERMGNSGYEAVIKTYNWGVDEKVLLSTIESVLSSRPQ